MNRPVSVSGLIGNTPLVRISPSLYEGNSSLHVKLEGTNPFGSHKDRTGLSMIEQAEKDADLTKKIVLSFTSGNTGRALAPLCKERGYKLTLTVPEIIAKDTIKFIESYGAKIVEPYRTTEDARYIAIKMQEEHPEKYHLLDQYDSRANIRAHFKTLEEILNQMDLPPTHLVVGIGTAGLIMGIAEGSKKKKLFTRIIGVYPALQEDLLGHRIIGLKDLENEKRPKNLNLEYVDGLIKVTTSEAYSASIHLMKGGFPRLLGPSSGAVVAAMMKLAREVKNARIVGISPDFGELYLPMFEQLAKKGLIEKYTYQSSN